MRELSTYFHARAKTSKAFSHFLSRSGGGSRNSRKAFGLKFVQ